MNVERNNGVAFHTAFLSILIGLICRLVLIFFCFLQAFRITLFFITIFQNVSIFVEILLCMHITVFFWKKNSVRYIISPVVVVCASKWWRRKMQIMEKVLFIAFKLLIYWMKKKNICRDIQKLYCYFCLTVCRVVCCIRAVFTYL